MDVTVRNFDEAVYRKLKAWAAYHGKSVGEAVTEIVRGHLARPQPWEQRGHLWDITTVPGRAGNERLSQVVDEVLYGWKK